MFILQLAQEKINFSEYFTWQLHVVFAEYRVNHLPQRLEVCGIIPSVNQGNQARLQLGGHSYLQLSEFWFHSKLVCSPVPYMEWGFYTYTYAKLCIEELFVFHQ